MTQSEIVLALDYGKARVGIAVSDALGLLAHPRPHLDASNRKSLLGEIVRLTKEEEVTRILVGLPLEMTGHSGPSAARAIAFAQAVADATSLEVELVDERLTTAEAKKKLGAAGRHKKAQRNYIDGASAAVLLQAWLDKQREPSDS